MYGDKLSVGDRVELHPSLDLWMMGARFGTVERCSGNTTAVVRLDATTITGRPRLRMIHLENLQRID
jgi:hypothetical protein